MKDVKVKLASRYRSPRQALQWEYFIDSYDLELMGQHR